MRLLAEVRLELYLENSLAAENLCVSLCRQWYSRATQGAAILRIRQKQFLPLLGKFNQIWNCDKGAQGKTMGGDNWSRQQRHCVRFRMESKGFLATWCAPWLDWTLFRQVLSGAARPSRAPAHDQSQQIHDYLQSLVARVWLWSAESERVVLGRARRDNEWIWRK